MVLTVQERHTLWPLAKTTRHRSRLTPTTRVITPPHALRKAVAPAGQATTIRSRAPKRRWLELSSEFAGWMQAECERLEAARQDVKRDGFTEKTHDALFRAAHDIKGEAATFGYPASRGRRRKPVPAARAHAGHDSAFRCSSSTSTSMPCAPSSANMPGPTVGDVASALTRRLREVTDDFLKRGKQLPAGLSGKHFRAAAGSGPAECDACRIARASAIAGYHRRSTAGPE